MDYRKFLRGVFVACSLAVLSGCVTMDQAYENVKQTASTVRERITALDFSGPEVESGAETMKVDQEESIPPVYGDDQPRRVIRAERGGDVVVDGRPSGFDALATQEQSSVTHTPMASSTPTAQCPRIFVVDELRYYFQFEDQNRPQPAGRISSAAIKDASGACQRNQDNVVVEMIMTLDGQTGPKRLHHGSDRPSFSYPYFIAVTTPQGQIISKEVFAVAISYEPGKDTATHREIMRHVIPYRGDGYDDSYELMVGFQLTEAELAYNRAVLGKPGEFLPPAAEPVKTTEPVKKAPVAKKKKVAPPIPAKKAEPPAAQPAAVEAETVSAPAAPAPVATPASETAPLAAETKPAAATPPPVNDISGSTISDLPPGVSVAAPEETAPPTPALPAATGTAVQAGEEAILDTMNEMEEKLEDAASEMPQAPTAAPIDITAP